MTVQLYHEPCADTLNKWFIIAALVAVLIGSIGGVFLADYEDKQLRRSSRSQSSRTLLRNQRRN